MPAFKSNWYDTSNKKKLFWILQLSGWGALILLGLRVVAPDTLILMPVLLGRGVLGA
ncbi:hypothetical protein HQ447_19680 [bacterium]|nr:hypothetical protein [bacterium]